MNEVMTDADFVNVFDRYNTAVGLARFVLLGFAFLAVAAAVGDWRRRAAWVSGVLGGLWIWAGIAFHWGFFADVNPMAVLFGAPFVAQGIAFLRFGVWGNELNFGKPRNDLRGVAGAVAIAYAMVVYPLISVAAGRAWPAMPAFGAPCPVTLFTCGLLLWSKGEAPRILLVVPVGWALLTTFVAVEFEMYEDWGLLVAAVVMAAWLWPREARRERNAARRRRPISQRIWRHACRK